MWLAALQNTGATMIGVGGERSPCGKGGNGFASGFWLLGWGVPDMSLVPPSDQD